MWQNGGSELQNYLNVLWTIVRNIQATPCELLLSTLTSNVKYIGLK